ncbi:MAG: aminotransferase class I/II-fold pyridoxal phosphate-dependent enzyme, partial [Candidatus Hodarchaeales archaeon]
MVLGIEDMNDRVIKAQYAVRGLIVTRAYELRDKGKKIVFCNIGNPQALGQKPFTYMGQLLALLRYPMIIEDEKVAGFFPADLIHRAKEIIGNNPNLVGKYSASPGVKFVRNAVSNFIEKRDGIPSNPDDIFMTDGASKGVDLILKSIIKKKNTGIMTPIPQYPLYSADITLFGGTQVPYYLNEDDNWQLDREDLDHSMETARRKEIDVKAIVVINPNNPTGSVLTYDNIKMIIEFAQENNLVIMADEVYQENIYSKEDSFYSFAKVMTDMNVDDITLFSFHSASKGLHGECGARGGYVEMRNVPPEVKFHLLKAQSISLCANLMGQLVMYAIVSPPEKGEESFNMYIEERHKILSSLSKRSKMMGEGLNSIDGISCVIPRGAMYVFPRIELPEAEYTVNGRNVAPDFHFCFSLLEETGICVVPGSGFGQAR